MAKITVVTTSWRLLDTNIFGVHAGGCYPIAYPAAPLLWRGKDPHSPAQTLWLMIDGAVVSHLIERRSHSLPSQSCLTVLCKRKSHELVFTFTWWFVDDSACSTICLEFVFLLPPVTWSTRQGFVHIKFVIRCCLHCCRFDIFSRWHHVDQFFTFHSMQQNKKRRKKDLIFQQQSFLKYSKSYWVKIGLQGCQGSVNRICLLQQLLLWSSAPLLGTVRWVLLSLWNFSKWFVCVNSEKIELIHF